MIQGGLYGAWGLGDLQHTPTTRFCMSAVLTEPGTCGGVTPASLSMLHCLHQSEITELDRRLM